MTATWLTLAKETIERHARVLQGVADRLGDEVVRTAQLLLECRGKVFVAGVGTSHAVAWRCAHLLSCSGVPAVFLHPGDALHGGSGAINGEDVVILISKGGRSDEVNKLAQIARGAGATTVAITGTPDNPLAQLVDLVLHVPTPHDADIHGTIATGSSLAASAVCDALCAIAVGEKGYSSSRFLQIHPGGAVGQRLKHEAGATSGARPEGEKR